MKQKKKVQDERTNLQPFSRLGEKGYAHNDNAVTHFALATRKGRKESGGVMAKVAVWFTFGDEERSREAFAMRN